MLLEIRPLLRMLELLPIPGIGDRHLSGDDSMDTFEAQNLLSKGELAAGSTISDALHIGPETPIPSIPSGLHAEKDLTLLENPALERVGDGVRVEGDFILEACPLLKEIGCGLYVARDCKFTACSELSSLGEDFYVGGDLDLAGCPPDIVLPQKGYVGDELILPQGYSQDGPPDGIRVGGEITWEYSVSLPKSA